MTSALPLPPTKATLSSSCAQIFCSLQCPAGCKAHLTSITEHVGCNHPPRLWLIFPIKLRSSAAWAIQDKINFSPQWLHDIVTAARSGLSSQLSYLANQKSKNFLKSPLRVKIKHSKDSYRHPLILLKFTLLLKHRQYESDRQHHSSCTTQLPGSFGKPEQSKDKGTPQTCS